MFKKIVRFIKKSFKEIRSFIVYLSEEIENKSPSRYDDSYEKYKNKYKDDWDV